MDEEKDSIDKDIKCDSVSNQTEEDKIKNIDENKEKLIKCEDEIIDIEIQEKRDKVKNDKKYFIVGIIISLLILIGIAISITISKYEKLVYPNVTIYEQDLSKLNKKQLKEKLKYVVNTIDKNDILIGANNKEYKLRVKDAISEYNINKISDDIMKYGKEDNFIKKFSKITFGKDKDYRFDISTNDTIIKNLVKKIADDTNEEVKEPEVIINNEDIAYKEGKNGIQVDEKELLDEIKKSIKKENIYNNNIKIKVKYKNKDPKISIKELKKVNKKISTYSTNYGAGGGRGKNVELAAKQLDNMILMPGDEFSYEKTLGDITVENGYSYAPVIINGELKKGVGGGVCQVSSTLYNTQLKAGILPTERRNHSKAVNYVPRGLDATLASGSIDYKFKNTYSYPIVINTKAVGGTLTIEFWSNEKALNNIEYKAVGYVHGKVANTYLYGYDKEGKKVYEKHIDTSVYK